MDENLYIYQLKAIRKAQTLCRQAIKPDNHAQYDRASYSERKKKKVWVDKDGADKIIKDIDFIRWYNKELKYNRRYVNIELVPQRFSEYKRKENPHAMPLAHYYNMDIMGGYSANEYEPQDISEVLEDIADNIETVLKEQEYADGLPATSTWIVENVKKVLEISMSPVPYNKPQADLLKRIRELLDTLEQQGFVNPPEQYNIMHACNMMDMVIAASQTEMKHMQIRAYYYSDILDSIVRDLQNNSLSDISFNIKIDESEELAAVIEGTEIDLYNTLGYCIEYDVFEKYNLLEHSGDTAAGEKEAIIFHDTVMAEMMPELADIKDQISAGTFSTESSDYRRTLKHFKRNVEKHILES